MTDERYEAGVHNDTKATADSTATDKAPAGETEDNRTRNRLAWFFVRGLVGYIGPADALESPEGSGFIPTRHELLELTRYWLTEKYAIDLSQLGCEQLEPGIQAIRQYANERLKRLWKVLDAESFNAIRSDVENEYRLRFGGQAWEIGTYGAEADRKQLLTSLEHVAEGSQRPSMHIVEQLAELSVRAFPDMGAYGLADSLRAAAGRVNSEGRSLPGYESDDFQEPKRYSRFIERRLVGHIGSDDSWKSPECPDYTATRHELQELGRYWLRERLKVEMMWLYGYPVDRRDGAMRNLAMDNLERIGEVLDKDGIKDVVANVENEFRRRLGDQDWGIYKHGPEEELKRLRLEAHGEEDEAPPYAADYLTELAVRVFPDMEAGTMAESLQAAADLVQTCTIHSVPCDHDWQDDDERQDVVVDVVVRFQRCRKCPAIRQTYTRQGDQEEDQDAKRGTGGRDIDNDGDAHLLAR